MVDENLDMSLTQAMPVREMRRTTPGVQGPTYRPKSVLSKLIEVSVIKAHYDIVKEN